MPFSRNKPPMSLPVVGGRAPAPAPVLIEPPRKAASGSPAEIMRAVESLKRDLKEAEEDLLNFWAHSLDYLMISAANALIDGQAKAADAPGSSVGASRETIAMGGHRLPAKARTTIRRIVPHGDPVTGAEIVVAVEQLRTNLALQLRRSAQADRERMQRMADAMHDVFGSG